jgi:hypothetical protein
MVRPGRNLSRPGECPVEDHTIGVVSMSIPIVFLYRPYPVSPRVPLLPPDIGSPIGFSSGNIPVFCSSCNVHNDRVHTGSSSSFWSHSSIFLLQKLRISGDMTRFICRSSVMSLTDLTRSLSLDTGKPRSLGVPQISITQVSRILVLQ